MEVSPILIEECIVEIDKYLREFREAIDLSGIEDEDFNPLYPAFTMLGILAHEAKLLQDAGQIPLSQEETDRMLARLDAVVAAALELVTPANRALLADVMDEIRASLAAALAGDINPYNLSQIWQQQFEGYGSYDFARLARTEIGNADVAMSVEQLVDDLDANTSVIDTVGRPLYHPNCLCDVDTIIGSDGIAYIVPAVSAAACGVCQDAATEAFNMVP